MRKSEKENKARVRVFFGEIEGDNETIRDSLRSIAAAVNKTFQQENIVVKVLPAGSDLDQNQLAKLAGKDIEEADFAEVITEVESSEIDKPHSLLRTSRWQAARANFARN